MPKRAAPSEAAPVVSKKVKAAAGAKAKASPAKVTTAAKAKTAKSKLAEAGAAAEATAEKIGAIGATVKKAASKAKAKVDEVLDNAGELLIDDVQPEPTATSRTQKAIAKGKKVAGKVKAKADEIIENAGDLLIDDVSDKPASKGKKRKTAEDFIDAEEPTAKKPAAAAPKAAKAAPVKTKGKKAAKEPSPEPEEEDDDDEEEGSVMGFETESEDGGADSSDDDSDAEDVAVREAAKKVNVNALAKPSKDDKSVAKRLAKAQKKKDVERGTIYLGRIPHGFYEDQMREYFGQFGDVTRLRLARNPKSGASRHYAYIEFSSLPVAEVVAETMHNYLLMGHILKCNVIPQDEIHPELWVGANKKFRKVPRARLEKVRQDKVSARVASLPCVVAK